MSIVTLNDRGVRSVSAFGSLNTGSMVFISKVTASSSATIDFTSGIDSTYKEYLFTFKNIHPATDSQVFTFQVDTGTNTNYNQTLTSTNFSAYHDEADSATSLGYRAGNYDQANGTAFQYIADTCGNENDECCSGTLHLFDPSNTTFVKHYISNMNVYTESSYTVNSYSAGYFNTTTAITRVRFKFASGNIDAGDICLYGIL
jgi:hypothetical protein